MTAVQIFLILAVSASAIEARTFYNGKCPTQVVKPNFDITKYYGKWYEVGRFRNNFELRSKCAWASFQPQGTDETAVYYTKQMVISGKKKTIKGTMTPTWDSTVAQYTLNFPGIRDFPAQHWVLSTGIDIPLLTTYSTYAIVWSCTSGQFGWTNEQHLWILSRTRSLSDANWLLVNAELSARGLKYWRLIKTAQDCAY